MRVLYYFMGLRIIGEGYFGRYKKVTEATHLFEIGDFGRLCQLSFTEDFQPR